MTGGRELGAELCSGAVAALAFVLALYSGAYFWSLFRSLKSNRLL